MALRILAGIRNIIACMHADTGPSPTSFDRDAAWKLLTEYTQSPSLIKHMHEFAREVHLTEEEWFQGIQFVTSVGQKCDDKRQEFILLSDTLGLSQLVVAQNRQ